MKRFFLLGCIFLLGSFLLAPMARAKSCAELGDFLEALGNCTPPALCGETNQSTLDTAEDCNAINAALTPEQEALEGVTCCITKPPEQPETSSPADSATSSGATGSSSKLTDPLGGANIYVIINRLVTTFLGVVGALALAVFVYAGVMWMTAGSSDRVKKAKDSMKYAIIGLAMIGFSYAIVSFFMDSLTNASLPSAVIK